MHIYLNQMPDINFRVYLGLTGCQNKTDYGTQRFKLIFWLKKFVIMPNFWSNRANRYGLNLSQISRKVPKYHKVGPDLAHRPVVLHIYLRYFAIKSVICLHCLLTIESHDKHTNGNDPWDPTVGLLKLLHHILEEDAKALDGAVREDLHDEKSNSHQPTPASIRGLWVHVGPQAETQRLGSTQRHALRETADGDPLVKMQFKSRTLRRVWNWTQVWLPVVLKAVEKTTSKPPHWPAPPPTMKIYCFRLDVKCSLTLSPPAFWIKEFCTFLSTTVQCTNTVPAEVIHSKEEIKMQSIKSNFFLQD